MSKYVWTLLYIFFWFFYMWPSDTSLAVLKKPWVDTILVFSAFLLTDSHSGSAISIWGVPSPHCRLNVSAVERLIAGHLLWVVNWTPQEESYQHNRNPFSDICHILWTQPTLVFSFQRGSLPLCLLCLKIRVSVGGRLWSTVATWHWRPRGVDEVCLKGKLSILSKTQQEPTATRRLSAHYRQNKKTLQNALSSSHL